MSPLTAYIPHSTTLEMFGYTNPLKQFIHINSLGILKIDGSIRERGGKIIGIHLNSLIPAAGTLCFAFRLPGQGLAVVLQHAFPPIPVCCNGGGRSSNCSLVGGRT